MKKIIFIGSGAVTSEVISYLDDIERLSGEKIYEIYGFLNDIEEDFIEESEKYGLEGKYLGTIKDHIYLPEYAYFFGFTNTEVKASIVSELDLNTLDFPNIAHPSVIIPKTAKLGVGNIIYPHCIIGPNCKIGNFNLITSYSFISHDCTVGNFNFLSTAGIAGRVTIGNGNFFGIRSTIIPKIVIGSNNTIQAGMVIDKNVSDNETVFYRFKEKVSIIKQF